jgi:hypothetical protein
MGRVLLFESNVRKEYHDNFAENDGETVTVWSTWKHDSRLFYQVLATLIL